MRPASVPAQPSAQPWQLQPVGAVPLGFRPPVLPAYPGMEPPPGYRAESHINTGLTVGGGVTLGAGYAIALGYAVTQDFKDGTGWLGAPVIGPWVAIGKRDFDCNVEGNDPLAEARECQQVTQRETRVISLLAALGMAQGVGAALFFIGLLDQRHEWVREDVTAAKLRFDAAPTPGGAAGLLSGNF
jgi:hypothetical protein